MRNLVKNGLRITIIVALATIFIGCATFGEQNAHSIDPPIGVISAMASELKLLVESADITRTDLHGGVEYHIGTLGGKDVVLVQAGVGKILSAAGAATLINEYGVQAIIFTGIAGGVADVTKVLDVVISTDLVVHDYGRVTNDGFVWGPNRGTVEGRIPATQELIDAAYNASVSVVGAPNTFRGTIATGDQFVASEWYVQELQQRFDAYATEMEGAAVALVAYQWDVPFVVIRCMSDKADGAAHATMDAFGQRAADNSASIVIALLESL
jgi:adenosylhomocysteine nucleosidase